MSRQKTTIYFFLIIFIGLLVYSCQKDKNIVSTNTDNSKSDISLDFAKTIALNFSNEHNFFEKPDKNDSDKKSKSFPGIQNKQIKESFTIDDNGIPALYVINYEPSGFIIIPSTKKEYPILAYSKISSIDLQNSPNGFKIWLKKRIGRIGNLKSKKNKLSNPKVKEVWDAVAPPPGEEETIPGGTVENQVGPLLQTLWGQGARFNDLVPDSSCTENFNNRAWTGCVATATAQIMSYWEYPNSYDWSIMPIWLDSNSVVTNGSLEVAQLMVDIGSAVNMDYGCEGSSASSTNVNDALEDIFGYSSPGSYLDFNPNTIVSQLDLG